ncbi:MAG: tetratricopeptide repeat protein [Deltaproteobacteria bacterium]|nr:tetratricopeptide repeat protein [Deltaproteobacteria bacterium]
MAEDDGTLVLDLAPPGSDIPSVDHQPPQFWYLGPERSTVFARRITALDYRRVVRTVLGAFLPAPDDTTTRAPIPTLLIVDCPPGLDMATAAVTDELTELLCLPHWSGSRLLWQPIMVSSPQADEQELAEARIEAFMRRHPRLAGRVHWQPVLNGTRPLEHAAALRARGAPTDLFRRAIPAGENQQQGVKTINTYVTYVSPSPEKTSVDQPARRGASEAGKSEAGKVDPGFLPWLSLLYSPGLSVAFYPSSGRPARLPVQPPTFWLLSEATPAPLAPGFCNLLRFAWRVDFELALPPPRQSRYDVALCEQPAIPARTISYAPHVRTPQNLGAPAATQAPGPDARSGRRPLAAEVLGVDLRAGQIRSPAARGIVEPIVEQLEVHPEAVEELLVGNLAVRVETCELPDLAFRLFMVVRRKEAFKDFSYARQYVSFLADLEGKLPGIDPDYPQVSDPLELARLRLADVKVRRLPAEVKPSYHGLSAQVAVRQGRQKSATRALTKLRELAQPRKAGAAPGTLEKEAAKRLLGLLGKHPALSADVLADAQAMVDLARTAPGWGEIVRGAADVVADHCEEEEGGREKAIEWYELLRVQEPEEWTSEVKHNLATLYRNAGRVREALALWYEAYEEAPQQESTRLAFAQLLGKLDHRREAERVLAGLPLPAGWRPGA